MKIKTIVSSRKVKNLLQLDGDVATYKVLGEKINTLDVEKKILRDKIMEHIDSVGTRDAKGNICAATSEYNVTKQRRASSRMDESKAEAVLTAKGILQLCTTTETYIDEEKIARAVEEGKLTRGEFESFMVEKESFALTVKEIKK